MRPTFALLTLAVLAAVPSLARVAQAADRVVSVERPKEVRKDLQAFPRIANPADAAERKINTAVGRLDDRVRRSAATCRNDDGTPGDWERKVDVPMKGPGFVSYAISDSTFCGGAHPGFGNTAIVYDLDTGDPVDWTTLLPPSLSGKVELVAQSDGVRMVTLSSKRLFELFLAGYDRERGDDPECKAAVRSNFDSAPPAMTVWLDAQKRGLAVQFDLPHAVQACADTVVIPAAVLSAEGAKPALLNALAAAPKS